MVHLVIVLSAQWQLHLDLEASLLWLLVCSFLVKMESSRQRRRLRHSQLRLIVVGLLQTAANTVVMTTDDPIWGTASTPWRCFSCAKPYLQCQEWRRSPHSGWTPAQFKKLCAVYKKPVEWKLSAEVPTSPQLHHRCPQEKIKPFCGNCFPSMGPGEFTASAPSFEMVEGVILYI